MLYFAIAITFLLIAVSMLLLYGNHLLKRIDNADARVVRLESAMDSIFAGKKAMEMADNKILKLRCKPDESCPKCHGRGHIGRNTTTGLFIGCTCCS